MAKVSVTTRVVVATKTILTCAKLHDASNTVQFVCDTALEKAVAESERSFS